jgi:hypothetical protein
MSMPTTDRPEPTNVTAAQDAIRYGIAVLPSHYPIRPSTRRQPDRLACSCGIPDCPTPARHPIGTITSEQATCNLAQITGWWTAHPNANPATIAGRTFAVIQARYPGDPDHVAAWLDASDLEPGPVIVGGPGLLQFPARGAIAAAARTSPLPHGGGVDWLADGTLVLLPPSRLTSGSIVRWLRPFQDRTVLLPDGEALFRALTRLPNAHDLARWAADHDAHQQAACPTR